MIVEVKLKWLRAITWNNGPLVLPFDCSFEFPSRIGKNGKREGGGVRKVRERLSRSAAPAVD